MIKEKKKKEKRINSKDKGDRFERIVANLFKKHWGVTSYKTPGSGSYTSRNVGRKMKEASCGDVVIEELPELIFECKNYESLHFSEWFRPIPKTKPKSERQDLWSFWVKLEKEAIELKKIPILIGKEKGAPIIAITTLDVANCIKDASGGFDTFFSMTKQDTHLVVFDLNEILELDLETIEHIIYDIQNDKPFKGAMTYVK